MKKPLKIIILVAIILLSGFYVYTNKNISEPLSFPVNIVSYDSDMGISINSDKTYTEYLHNRISHDGTWKIDDNKLILSSNDVANEILDIKNGLAFSDDYISIPQISFFKDFSGIPKDIFLPSDDTEDPLYSIGQFAYSSFADEYLIMLEKYDEIGSFQPIREYRCFISKKKCEESTIITTANEKFKDLSLMKADLAYEGIDYIDTQISWRRWNPESGKLSGFIIITDDEGISSYGLVYNTKTIKKESSPEIDSGIYDFLYER